MRKVLSADNRSIFYRVCAKFVTRFASKINRQICRQVARVSREQNIATTLICYARHVMLQTGQQQEKTRVFKIYSSRFLDITYLNGCEQRLLFARQLTQRKCSLCLQGNCWEAQIYLSSEVGLKNMLLHPFCLEKPDSQSN